MPDWRLTLGQVGAAAGHLRNQHVTVGDLFLFYGWFRRTSMVNGRLRFRQGDDGFHAIYGYLQIGQILNASGDTKLPKWLHDHPHADSRRMAKATNVIYVAADHVGNDSGLPGAGVFCFDDALALTKRGLSRSRWNLDPDIFRHLEISYHNENSWHDGYFQSYPRAQEYVIHADAGVIHWAQTLISEAARWG